jgi:hypothetical protein
MYGMKIGKEQFSMGDSDVMVSTQALELNTLPLIFLLFYHFYIYSHVYTLFGPSSLPPLHHPVFSNFVENIR